MYEQIHEFYVAVPSMIRVRDMDSIANGLLFCIFCFFSFLSIQ